jgi:sigma-B regulation protein RsbU (phosphoserine phosphatase)
VRSDQDVLTVPEAVYDPKRLAAVHATGLLDTGPEDNFDRLASLAATLLDAPMAFVTLVDERRSFWKSAVGAIPESVAGERETPVEHSFCQHVIASSGAVFVDDAERDPRTSGNPLVQALSVKAWAGFPVRSPGGDILGSFCVVDHRPRRWSARDVEVLRTLSYSASGEIALLDAVEVAQREARRSTALARTLQESLLAPVLPHVPGLELASRYRPAGAGGELAGDFFDVFQGIGERWHAVIGDVCGKGVEAAKMTALARYTLRAAAMRGGAPSAMLTELNAALEHQAKGHGLYLTALVATVCETDAGFTATLALAGHPPALLRRADGTVEEAGRHGSLLGIFARVTLHDVDLLLGPGDVLVLHTDGLTDARRADERFGEARLYEAIAAGTRPSAAALVADIDATVAGFSDGPADDDLALLVLRVGTGEVSWDRG